jgi:hypothetical protein
MIVKPNRSKPICVDYINDDQKSNLFFRLHLMKIKS